MPKEILIRSQIRAGKGNVLIQCDLSGAEAWVVAYLADDPNMKYELANGDLHSFTACHLFDIPFKKDDPMYASDGKTKVRYAGVTKEKRYPGKRTNHSSNYMQGAGGLMVAINTERIITISLPEAKRYQDVWQSIFYNVPLWWGKVKQKIWDTSTLETVYGFKRTFYGSKDDALFRVAIAFEPQSTVGDHCLGAIQPGINEAGGLLEFHKRHKKHGDINIINTSHDSGVVECPAPVAKEIGLELSSLMRRPLMINGEVFTIPVDTEVGERYGELERMVL